METIRYYRLMDLINESDALDTTETHIVNCAGFDTLSEPFHNIRPFGRKDNYMIYVTDGTVYFNTEKGETAAVKKGMGIFLHSDHRHDFFTKSDQTSFYWIHFTGKLVSDTLIRFGFIHEFIFDIGHNEKLIHLFQKIFNEFISRKPDYIYSSALYLQQMFVEIERSLSKAQTEKRNLDKSLTYIHANYLNDIPIEKLAMLEEMSISHYRSIFMKLMSVSPKRYITSLRISYASSLLQYTNQPIKEIAVQCGYEDLGYFYRVFKKITNMTPVHCRNKKRIGVTQ